MFKFILAILLLLSAGVIFFFQIDPLVREPVVMGADNQVTAGGLLALRDYQNQLKEALANAQSLQERLNQLRAEINALPQDNIRALDTFIPTENDPVLILVELDEVAREVNLTLRDTQVVREESMDNLPGSIFKVVISGQATGTYRQLEVFLNRLADRQRPFNITNLSFKVEIDEDNRPANAYQFNFTVHTYQLR